MFYLKLYCNNNDEEKPFTFKTMEFQTKNEPSFNELVFTGWCEQLERQDWSWIKEHQLWAFGGEDIS